MTIQNLAIVIGPTVMRPKIEPNPLEAVAQNEKKCAIVMNCIDKYEQIFAVKKEIHSFFFLLNLNFL